MDLTLVDSWSQELLRAADGTGAKPGASDETTAFCARGATLYGTSAQA